MLVLVKILLFIINLILFSQLVYANIIINEIMANPMDDEFLNEYIEIYNPTGNSVDVSGWIIGDLIGNDTIDGGLYGGNGTIIYPGTYALITDDTTRVYNNFKVMYNTTKLYIGDDALGNGLTNTGDSLFLYDASGDLVDKLTYNNTQDGLSLSRDIEGSFWNANPTPGYSNNGSFVDYYENECDWKIEIILDEQYFNNSDDFEFGVNVEKIGGSSTNITLYREIKDVYGRVVSNYNPKIKTAVYKSNFDGPWTPNYSPGLYFINTTIKTVCNDFNLENNQALGFFIIKEEELDQDSEISIENVYLGNDKKAKWGDTVRVKITVYRGETGKKSISLGLEQDLSKKNRFNAEDKFEKYILTLPVQIDLNCDRKIEDGFYELILEGLGKRDSEKIEIEGGSDLCDNKTSSKSIKVEEKIRENTNQNYEKVIYNESREITGEVIYESNDVKAKRSAIYFFCALLIFLILQRKKDDTS